MLALLSEVYCDLSLARFLVSFPVFLYFLVAVTFYSRPPREDIFLLDFALFCVCVVVCVFGGWASAPCVKLSLFSAGCTDSTYIQFTTI